LRAAALIALGLAGCTPQLGSPPSLVTSARVAAVRFEPAEAAPGASVTARAFVVSPSGVAMPSLAWTICTTPKPAVDNDAIDPACLTPSGASALGDDAQPITLTLPLDACRRFGPDTPPATPGQPPIAPRAPDLTGGYYQPLVATLDGATAVGLARLRCALAGASPDAAAAFAATYTSNRNPSLTPLGATVAGQPVALDALPAGRPITLAVGWTADSPETFPVLDPASQDLVQQREALTVSWLASTGSFAAAHTGSAAGDLALATTNQWSAPAGPAHLFVVLRDSRGGVDFAAYDVNLVP
jgi:hypothetical protein